MPDRSVFPYDYDQCDFANGLRLITAPTPFPHVVSLYIVVHAGSRNEVEEGRSGFAHFFEHMMFRGTPEYPPERYEAVLQEAGAASNAYTDDDHTAYHATVSREDIERVLAMEADRFMHLEYSVDDFRTEALAVLGEYNKDSAEPANKLAEVLRDNAFERHTYKHTTMGFLRDIERMPEMYDYSRQFFERFYRPEWTTVIVVGDVRADEVREMVERHWGTWRRGSHVCVVPQEPAPRGPKEASIAWPVETLPYLLTAYRSAAYTDTDKDCAALDLISYLGFSESSPLYQKLVIDEQVADMLLGANTDHVDPYLFTVLARVKDSAELPRVQEEIQATFAGFAESRVDEARLEAVKRHLRYRFLLGLNNSESIAEAVAHFVALRRTPETINRLHRVYEALTPQDIQRVAQRYFTEAGRTTVTLQSGEGAGGR